MASPIVANLGAKIMVWDPCLTAAEVRALIVDTADLITLPVETKQEENLNSQQEQKVSESRTVKVVNIPAALKQAKVLSATCQIKDKSQNSFAEGN